MVAGSLLARVVDSFFAMVEQVELTRVEVEKLLGNLKLEELMRTEHQMMSASKVARQVDMLAC